MGLDTQPADSEEMSRVYSQSNQDAQWARDFTAEYTALVQPPLNPVLHASCSDPRSLKCVLQLPVTAIVLSSFTVDCDP